MSTLHRWLSRLPLDPRSQRAIEETVFDWRAEKSRCCSFGARLRCHGVNALALLRTLALVSVREMILVARPSLVARVGGFSVLMAGVLLMPSWFESRSPVQLPWSAEFFATVFILVPVAAYLAALAEAPRRPPVLALTLISAVMMALSRAAIVPIVGAGALSVSSWLMAVAWTASLVLIADRALLDRRRWLMSIVAPIAPFLVVVLYTAVRLSIAIRVSGHGQTVSADWVLPATYALTWWLMIRRQENALPLGEPPEPTSRTPRT